jgi:ferredoxin-NADP reductase
MATAAQTQAQDIQVPVVVDGIEAPAEGVRSMVLRHREGKALPGWTPGAHIDLVFTPDLARPYSLCGDPDDRDHWRVAILREPEGRGGSDHAHVAVQEGDALIARGPRNHFPLVDADDYLLVAGGIGITPLLPMIGELERRGARWRLLYGGRRRASMAFVDQLAQAHGERVTIVPEDEFGRPDLTTWLGESQPGRAVYCCGPEGLIDAVQRACAGWPEDAVHVERFRPNPGALAGEATTFEVVAAQSGLRVTVSEDETIVEALDAAGVYIPTSCGEGTCATCVTRVLEGEADHRDALLTDEERGGGDFLPCCSRSKTPVIVLDV